MDTIVGTVLGQSIALGMITSAITQVIKITEGIPGLRQFHPVQVLFDFVDSASPRQVQVFAAIVALGLNALTVYMRDGTIISTSTAFSTFGSYLTALGTYSALKPQNNG